MKQIIKNLFDTLQTIRLRNSVYKRDKMFIKKHSLPKLTKNERKKISRMFKSC